MIGRIGRTEPGLRILVLTIVHHPGDARILHREIAALLDRGHCVVYAAPFSATGFQPPPGVEAVDLPRAAGRSRFAAWKAARAVVRRHRDDLDLVVFHDPELIVALSSMRKPPTVWDVHEDTAATLVDKAWLPAPAKRMLRPLVRAAEHLAERRYHLLLADSGYEANFVRAHPVIPNETRVPADIPPPGRDRVVALGRVSTGRGAPTLLALAKLLPPGVTLDVIGPADEDVRPSFERAHRDGTINWRGFVPNDEALSALDGALAGLNLVGDLPNYRSSRQTKVFEYMAHGVPVITTPVSPAAKVVDETGCGVVVPFGDAAAAAAALARLREDASLREAMGRSGHAAAQKDFDWNRSAQRFVAALEEWARG